MKFFHHFSIPILFCIFGPIILLYFYTHNLSGVVIDSWLNASQEEKKSKVIETVVYPITCTYSLFDLFFNVETQVRQLDRVRNIPKDENPSMSEMIDVLTRQPPIVSQDKQKEAELSLKAALQLKQRGKLGKARRVLEHAHTLNPNSADILMELGQVIEESSHDIMLAEYYYHKALRHSPTHKKALLLKNEAFPLVQEMDQKSLRQLDLKVRQLHAYHEFNADFRHIKRKQYVSNVYNSNAIEGNTLSFSQTQSILETRIAIGGKSLFEQNEVLGLDAALKYINSSLLRPTQRITLEHILEIHRRVLGFVDLTEAGNFRQTQVYIAGHTPPPAHEVPRLMNEFLAWLNSAAVQQMHAVELAALAHWYLVHIHPFYDGNGRTARLLMDAILMRNGYPPAIIRIEDRAQYYEYLNRADDGDVRWFIRLVVQSTERSVDELLQCVAESTVRSPGDSNAHVAREAQALASTDVADADHSLPIPRVIYLQGH